MHKCIEPQKGRGSKGIARRKNGLRKDSIGHEDIISGGDERRGSGGEEEEGEFMGEIGGVLDWCGRVVVPALSDGFTKR